MIVMTIDTALLHLDERLDFIELVVHHDPHSYL